MRKNTKLKRKPRPTKFSKASAISLPDRKDLDTRIQISYGKTLADIEESCLKPYTVVKTLGILLKGMGLIAEKLPIVLERRRDYLAESGRAIKKIIESAIPKNAEAILNSEQLFGSSFEMLIKIKKVLETVARLELVERNMREMLVPVLEKFGKLEPAITIRFAPFDRRTARIKDDASDGAFDDLISRLADIIRGDAGNGCYNINWNIITSILLLTSERYNFPEIPNIKSTANGNLSKKRLEGIKEVLRQRWLRYRKKKPVRSIDAVATSVSNHLNLEKS